MEKTTLQENVKEKMETFPQKILLASDGSNNAAQAARAAVRLSGLSGSELHVVHVSEVVAGMFPPEETLENSAELKKVEAAMEQQARRRLDREVERIRQQGAEVTEAHLRVGVADQEIIAVSEELGADLVVVGSRGLNDMKRMLLGSVSESVVRHAPCPVLVAHQ